MQQLVFSFCFIALYLSCDQPQPTAPSEGALTFSIGEFMRQGGPCTTEEGPCATIDLRFPVAETGPPALRQTVNDSIRQSLSYLMMSVHPSESDQMQALETGAEQFLADYLDFLKEVPDYQLPWVIETEGEVLFNTAKVLSIQLASYSFTGGAHPNTSLTLLNFDSQTGKTLQYEDLISDLPAFHKLAETAFRKATELSAGDSLEDAGYFWDGGFQLPANFGLTAEGLLLYYNTYEIGPYVLGATEFTLPYSEIKALLKKEVM